MYISSTLLAYLPNKIIISLYSSYQTNLFLYMTSYQQKIIKRFVLHSAIVNLKVSTNNILPQIPLHKWYLAWKWSLCLVHLIPILQWIRDSQSLIPVQSIPIQDNWYLNQIKIFDITSLILSLIIFLYTTNCDWKFLLI